LTHADPASDLPAAVLALEARMKVVGPAGEKVIPADRFFVDMLQSAVGPGEILTEVRITKSPAGSGAAYMKVPHPASGFAVVGVATNLTLSGGKCTGIAIGITGVAAKPYRAGAVEGKLRGTELDAATLKAACGEATQGVTAQSDNVYASAEYRRALAAVYTRRSVEAAAARARGR
ncbi:MAG: FAD binding domain-containing protein, partial [Gammaproteobacteria bacterium]